MPMIRSSHRSLVYYACTNVIEQSVDEPNELCKVAPKMYEVIEMLVGQLSEDQLNEVEDIIVNQFGED